MPINQAQSELTQIAGYPDGTTFEAVVGDSINITPLVTGPSQTLTLVQKPSGSTAALSSGAFTADLAGCYLVTIANGGASRQICFYCFPAAVLGKAIGGGGNQPVVTRSHLRMLAQSQNYGALAAGATNALRTQLEGAAPTVFVPPVNFSTYLG